MAPAQFTNLEHFAWTRNRWIVVAAFQASERQGHVPNGSAIVHRPEHPLGEDRAWAVVNWADRGDHVDFWSGDYDLPWRQAVVHFIDRLEFAIPAGTPDMSLRAAYPALALIQEGRHGD